MYPTQQHIQVIVSYFPRTPRSRTASFGLVQRIREAFARVPGAWQSFKDIIGVTSNKISALHEGLQKVLVYGKKKIRKIGANLLNEIPILSDLLGITIETDELESWVDTKVFSKMSFQDTNLLDVGVLDMPAKVLDELLSKSVVLRTMSRPAKAYLFLMMFSAAWDWDYAEFLSGIMGELSFSDLAAMAKQEGIKGILDIIFAPYFPNAGNIIFKVAQLSLLGAAAFSKTQSKVRSMSPAQRVQFFLNRWSEMKQKHRLLDPNDPSEALAPQ